MTTDPHTTASNAGWTPLERELYEALVKVFMGEGIQIEVSDGYKQSGHWAKARRVLAKARGETP